MLKKGNTKRSSPPAGAKGNGHKLPTNFHELFFCLHTACSYASLFRGASKPPLWEGVGGGPPLTSTLYHLGRILAGGAPYTAAD